MIFKQIDEILSGQKTQTRRVCKPNEYENNPSEPPSDCESVITETLIPGTTGSVLRTKWAVGRTYAVVPGRGQPAVWWREADNGLEWDRWIPIVQPNDIGGNRRESAILQGWQPLRIRITAIRREPLQSITEADAIAEGMPRTEDAYGVSSIELYKHLWDSINGKTRGARWSDNPDVWVIGFELVTEGAR